MLNRHNPMKVLISLFVSLFLASSLNTIDSSKIRFGSVKAYNDKGGSVGLVDSKKVYGEIPAYKTIKKEKLKKGSARYNKLIGDATKVFKSSLKAVAKAESLNIVVEVGGVKDEPKTLDISQKIIDHINKAPL